MRHVPALCVIFCLAACDKGDNTINTSNDTLENVPDAQSQQSSLDTVKGLTQQASETLKTKWKEADITSFKTQATSLKQALEGNNFTKANEAAEQLGKSLDSSYVKDCVGFFEIQSREGGEAARKAIDNYLGNTEMPEELRIFFTNLRTIIDSMDTEQKIDAVAFVISIACHIKFGQGGDKIGYLVGEALKQVFVSPRPGGTLVPSIEENPASPADNP